MVNKKLLDSLHQYFVSAHAMNGRVVVFWHDADGSYFDDFHELDEDAVKGDNPLHLVDYPKSSKFELKKMIARDNPDDDFLIYIDGPKDMSAKGLEGNWLADIELLSEHFQPDFDLVLPKEIHFESEAKAEATKFLSFFKSEEMAERFLRLAPRVKDKRQVDVVIIGAILNSNNLSIEEFLRNYIKLLLNDGNPSKIFSKYKAEDLWSEFLTKRIGYEKDPNDLRQLVSYMILTGLSAQLPEEIFTGIEDQVSIPHAQICLSLVHRCLDEKDISDHFYELIRDIENEFNLNRRLANCTEKQLLEVDILPCVNEKLIANLSESMANDVDRSDEVLEIVQRRKNMYWYDRMKPYYETLAISAKMKRFHQEHIQGFHLVSSRAVWDAYTDPTSGWWQMDAYYRNFCAQVDLARGNSYEIASYVEDSLELLVSWMERLYVNWFLADANDCWISASEKSWLERGYAGEILKQEHFYENYVAARPSNVKKICVIISDGLRYEVAAELSQRLENNTKGQTELQSMQAIFPSITEFGMAALLPHKSISFNSENGGVCVDGLPTVSCAQREKVLQSYAPNSLCLQSRDLLAARRAEQKELIGGADIVYLYHNKIDAIGEDYATEHSVFDACERAMNDISKLVSIMANNLGFTHILITADHGFLYTRDPLEESVKISSKDMDGNVVKLGRRYAINDQWTDDTLFIKMNLDHLRDNTYLGFAPRRCVRIKKPGPGENYVHGGVSLQEMCVPVIHFHNKRSGAKDYRQTQTTTLKLLSQVNKINSMVFSLEFLQEECVTNKVKSSNYMIYVTDSQGNKISNVRSVEADSTNPDATKRVYKVQFTLKPGPKYQPSENYFLVLVNKETADHEEHQLVVDIPFAPEDDFGF